MEIREYSFIHSFIASLRIKITLQEPVKKLLFRLSGEDTGT
jgi:hypothetical protein